jgi:hypothetical protein
MEVAIRHKLYGVYKGGLVNVSHMNGHGKYMERNGKGIWQSNYAIIYCIYKKWKYCHRRRIFRIIILIKYYNYKQTGA